MSFIGQRKGKEVSVLTKQSGIACVKHSCGTQIEKSLFQTQKTAITKVLRPEGGCPVDGTAMEQVYLVSSQKVERMGPKAARHWTEVDLDCTVV